MSPIDDGVDESVLFRSRSCDTPPDPGPGPLLLSMSLLEAEEQLDRLYELHDGFFSSSANEKRALLAAQAALVLSALPADQDDASPPSDGDPSPSSTDSRARRLYIRGRTLDVHPEHSSEAEDCLSRALKLAPDDTPCLVALGHCLWKKGDLKGASGCFETALKHGDDPDALRHLSMLLRTVSHMLLRLVQAVLQHLHYTRMS